VIKTVWKQQNMKNRISTILLSIFFLASISSCGGGGGGSVGGGTVVPSASLVSIEVTPVDPVIALGTTAQLKATGIYSDNTKKDLTSTVEWDTSDISVASVHNGLASPIARGSATIKAASGSVSGSRTLTVTTAALVSIHVTPVNPNAALGTTSQFTATGIFSDDSVQDLTSQAAWSSSDGSVASVSNAAGSIGLATSFEMGSTTISATLDNVTGSTDLAVTPAVLVSIQVTPTNPGIAKGTTRQFAATGIYSDHSIQDLTKQVLWSSSDASVASVSDAAGSNGLASALAVGNTSVSAALGGVTGTTNLEVTAATLGSIDVTPANPTLAKGTKRQLAATGTYSDHSTQDLTTQVTWGTSDTSVISVSNAAGSNGLASALGVGTTSVSATLGGVTGTTTLEVTAATLAAIQMDPADPVVAMDVIQEFTATGIYSDSSTQDLTLQVTWSSSDTCVASISNAVEDRGVAIPAGYGTTKISATLDGVWGGTTLTVSKANLVGIKVTPADRIIGSGKTLQYTATSYYSDGMTLDITKSAVWKSSDNKVVKVTNAKKRRCLAEGDEPGTATISAKLGGKMSGSTTLTVE